MPIKLENVGIAVRDLEAAIERLKQTLPKLSRQQRDGTVQVAMDGMTLLRV